MNYFRESSNIFGYGPLGHRVWTISLCKS